ncbi:unnamed protein product [Effrenium voratum]|nr:unnamed protein product [Effrenium voratum]
MAAFLLLLLIPLAEGVAVAGRHVHRHRHLAHRLDQHRRQALRRLRSTTASPVQMLLQNEEKLKSMDDLYDRQQSRRSHDTESMMSSLVEASEPSPSRPRLSRRQELAMLQQTQVQLRLLGFRRKTPEAEAAHEKKAPEEPTA